MDEVKILLVDDHQVIREGLRSYLENNQTFTIVAEAAHGKEALEKLQDEIVDLVIIDINMDVMDGIECTREISKNYPDVKILAFTMVNEGQHIKEMMNAGASGYLLKSSPHSEIVEAIDTIMGGGTHYSQEVTSTVMNNLLSKKVQNSSKSITDIPLTTREKEVLQLISQEYSNQEIADTLFISTRTVEAHKRNLLEKTGCKNVAGLILYAINKRIIEL